MSAIDSLEPQAIWSHFSKILSIPRPSGYEGRIADHIVEFAKQNGLSYTKDAVNNVIIDSPATKGRENTPSVILQAHIDMVPVAAAGVEHDFKNDPIDAYVEDGWVKAHGTTLGADDGLGVATILAILEDKNLSHGPLRAVFTVEEETTMKGAGSLDKKYLDADYLINLDSEDNGKLFVSCAGSAEVSINFSFERVLADGCEALSLRLSDLSGGHSGSDINKGHANAISVMAAILNEISDECDFFIQDINGGQVRNSIPSDTACTVCCPKDETCRFTEAFKKSFEKYRNIYKATDPNMKLEISSASCAPALSYADSLSLIELIRALPIGPSRMFDIDPSIVETSCNLGTIRSFDGKIVLGLMPRSLKEDNLDDIIDRINATAYLLDNTETEIDSRHFCWESPDKNSLIDAMQQSYRKVTGNEFQITAIHAGLECAAFSKMNPKLQLVSVGSTIINPHSPKERAEILGAKQIFETVKNTIENI